MVGIEVIALACREDCEECISTSKTGCIKCKEGKILWKGECLAECPLGYYFESDTCHSCPITCATCTSSNICITCLSSFYKYEGTCIDGTQCPPNMYPNSTTMACELCSKGCLTCTGPTNFDCADCNYLKGYGRINQNSEECQYIACTEGTYLIVDKEKKTCRCGNCHRSCKTCDSIRNCLECKQGHIRSNSTDESGSLCFSCPEGYITQQNGTCQGIFLTHG